MKHKEGPMEQTCCHSYISQIAKTKTFDHQETLRLARLAKTGDIDARNRIVEGNLRFVTKIASTYKGKGLPLDDLINEGSLGLMTAVERFDPDSGNSFLTYAKFWIHQSISLGITPHSVSVRGSSRSWISCSGLLPSLPSHLSSIRSYSSPCSSPERGNRVFFRPVHCSQESCGTDQNGF